MVLFMFNYKYKCQNMFLKWCDELDYLRLHIAISNDCYIIEKCLTQTCM